MYRRGAGRGAARTGYAPVSYQTARISFELHVCVKWMSMPCTALELPDSSEQKVRIVERDDPPLHVERVEHPSIAGYSLETFGPGQPLAARARWRRAFTSWMSAKGISRSEGRHCVWGMTNREPHWRQAKEANIGDTLIGRNVHPSFGSGGQVGSYGAIFFFRAFRNANGWRN